MLSHLLVTLLCKLLRHFFKFLSLFILDFVLLNCWLKKMHSLTMHDQLSISIVPLTSVCIFVRVGLCLKTHKEVFTNRLACHAKFLFTTLKVSKYNFYSLLSFFALSFWCVETLETAEWIWQLSLTQVHFHCEVFFMCVGLQ